MTRDAFNALVSDILDTLPNEFQDKLENVVVTVEDWPTIGQLAKLRLPHESTLFGLYEGIPKTRRGASYTFVPPDTITIFQKPIEFFYRNPDAIKQKVKETVLHEIGHHFGLTDEAINKAQRS